MTLCDTRGTAGSTAAVRDRSILTTSHGALAVGDATFHAGWTLHRALANPTAGQPDCRSPSGDDGHLLR